MDLITRHARVLTIHEPSRTAWPGRFTRIEIDGALATILETRTYRGRMGRTFQTDRGFVQLPVALGQPEPPALLDGEPAAPTIIEAREWHATLAERAQRFRDALIRIGEAETETITIPAGHTLRGTSSGLMQLHRTGAASNLASLGDDTGSRIRAALAWLRRR